MTRGELKVILKEGEGYKVEFKEKVSNIEKELVAFANSSGGKILIGVTDDGKIKGVNITNRLKSMIQDIANNCRPGVKISLESAGNILIVNVKEGEDKPYECASGFYKRIGSNSQKMTRNELIRFFKAEGKIRFDELIEPKFSYSKDFDRGKFKRFLQLADISGAGGTEKLLVSLGVAEKQEGRLYFNNAGILFFAKEPQRFIPWSVYTVALFKDEAGVDIIDRKEITGSLFEIVEEVMKFVRLYTKVAYRFTGRPRRENVYEYAFDAIREAVINSVMHKYYFEHGHNNILRFFPDRIRIENYWQRPPHFVLGRTVFRRNHIVADLFSRIHFGEKMGTGFERIRQICKREKAPYPDIEFTENYFYITFKQSYEYLKLAGERPPKEEFLTTTQKTTQKILVLIKQNPHITRKELAQKIGNITEEGIKYHLTQMKKKGVIRRFGPDRGGYWQIIDGR